jgi:hypothetical protein
LPGTPSAVVSVSVAGSTRIVKAAACASPAPPPSGDPVLKLLFVALVPQAAARATANTSDPRIVEFLERSVVMGNFSSMSE